MKSGIKAIAIESSYLNQVCEEAITQFELLLTEYKVELSRLNDSKHYTKEIKQRKLRVEMEISGLERRIEETRYMDRFYTGAYVQNGTNKPGKVIQLYMAGKVPEVHVRWWGATVPVPERPMKLKLISAELMNYVWNGDRFPKLLRRLDGVECEDLAVLEDNLERQKACLAIATNHGSGDEAKNEYQRQITYLKKRISFLGQPKRERIPLNLISREDDTQQRVKLNHETVTEYAEAMRQGDKFPPVKLTYDGFNYWLTDGFHTTEAVYSIGEKYIEAIVSRGSKRDAILESTASNTDHGLKRSNADKRKAVATLLEDEEWRQWSDREISRRCKVSQPFVSRLRSQLTVNVDSENQNVTDNVISDNPRKYKDKYGNESQMNTSNIGIVNKESLLTQNAENINQDLLAVRGFEVGQLVRMNTDSDRSDKRLVGLQSSLAVIKAVNTATVDLKFFGRQLVLTAVSPNDIIHHCSESNAVVCLTLTYEEAVKMTMMFDSEPDIIKAAIAFGSQGI